MNTRHQESTASSPANGSGVEKIRIRKISWMDWRKLTRLFRDIFPELSALQVSYYIRNYDNTIAVAESNEGLVGFYQFIPRTGEKTAWLNYLGVIPARYRSGIATRLLRDYEECAARMGFRQAEFDVLQQNDKAIRFYEKHGYTRLYPLGDKFRYQKLLTAGLRVAEDPRSAQTRPRLARFGRRVLYLVLVSLPLLLADIF